MTLYFAYGSNLHPMRISDRVGSARLVATGFVAGRTLSFSKRGRDGSAKCDAPVSPRAGDRVYGALYRLDDGDRAELDRIEELGAGYDHAELQVETATGPMPAFAYIAQPAYVEPDLPPYGWYQQLVLAGVRFHRFADAYRAAISAVRSVEDPDQQRAQRHRSLLARIAASQAG